MMQKVFLAGLLTCAALAAQSACGVAPIRENVPTETAAISPTALTVQPTPAPEDILPTSPSEIVPESQPALTETAPAPTPEVSLSGSPTALINTAEPTDGELISTPATEAGGGEDIPAAPLATVGIIKPGPQSRVVSPISLEASVIPVDRGIVRVELLGEDGRVLFREVQRYGETAGKRVYLNLSVEFEIPSVAEAAQLNVSVEDPEGRPVALTSVDIVLLSMGTSEVYTAAECHEPVIFQQPRLNQFVRGSSVNAEGFIHPVNTQPIILELIDTSGQVVGTRQVAVEPNQVDTYVPFAVEIPSTLQHESWTRLVARQSSARIPSPAMLSSLLFYLKP